MIIAKKGHRLVRAASSEILAVGDLVHLNSSGLWTKSLATTGTATYAMGVVTMACASGGYPEVCRWAYAKSYTTGLTKGGKLYLAEGTSYGASTETAPSTAGDVVQVVGRVLNATTDVYLEPAMYYEVVPAPG